MVVLLMRWLLWYSVVHWLSPYHHVPVLQKQGEGRLPGAGQWGVSTFVKGAAGEGPDAV